jgi:hypothetical protein
MGFFRETRRRGQTANGAVFAARAQSGVTTGGMAVRYFGSTISPRTIMSTWQGLGACSGKLAAQSIPSANYCRTNAVPHHQKMSR